MAKGRKLTTSRSERYLGSYCYGDSNGTVAEASELGEEDVWSMVNDMVNGGDDDDSMDSRGEWSPRTSAESDGGSRGQLRQVGGLSLAFEDTGKTFSPRVVHQFRGQESVPSRPRGLHMARSAPVNVPDWSKINRVDSVESLHGLDDGVDDDHEAEMVPPHEYLARDRKRSEKSVFEGVGRTLKGRDLRRVRDAVWSQTGFNG